MIASKYRRRAAFYDRGWISKMDNFPAVSDRATMEKYPEARRLERDALIEQVEWCENFKVVDIQSAGGFVSDRVYQMLGGQVECYCIEPCATLRSRLKPVHHPVADPVECFPSVQDKSMDVALGLAALHHSGDHLATLKEARRALKDQGQISICDVIEGSNIAAWLNEFVDKHNPVGHQGRFIEEDTIVREMELAGFTRVEAVVRQVPWLFDSEEDIPVFFRGLFNLDCTDTELRRAIAEYFQIVTRRGRMELGWELLYLKADAE